MTYEEAKTRHGVTLVEFYADWCPHCRRMAPVVDEVKEVVVPEAAVCQYDIDVYSNEAESAGVDTVPTFIIYKDGKEVWRKVGEMPAAEIVNAIRNA